VTNVSFDQNHGSGEQNAPTLPGGRCEQHAAASQRLAPAPCRTHCWKRCVGFLRWGWAIGCWSSAQLGAPRGLCRRRDRVYLGLCCFAPLHQPKASLWEGYGWVQTENRRICNLYLLRDSNNSWV